MVKSDKKREAIALLSEGVSQIRTAEILRINRRTITRWLEEASFREELLQGRKERLESVLQEFDPNSPSREDELEEEESANSPVARLVSRSLSALDEILRNPETRTADRLRAAQLVLQLVAGNRVENLNQSSTDHLPSSSSDREAQIETMMQRWKELKTRRDRLLEAQESH